MDLPIEQCANGVNAPIVEAIIQAESGRNPWAIHVNVNDGEADPLLVPSTTKEQAIAQARALQAQGYSFDVGLMQVNSVNIARLGVPLEAAFDVCNNLNMGTTVFNEFAAGARKLIAQFNSPEKQLMATLSAYNTGSYWKGFTNGYVHRVMRYMNQPLRPLQVKVAAVNAPMEVSLSFDTDLTEEGDAFSVSD